MGAFAAIEARIGLQLDYGAETETDVDLSPEDAEAFINALAEAVAEAVYEIKHPLFRVLGVKTLKLIDWTPAYQEFRDGVREAEKAKKQAERFEGPLWGTIKPIEM